MKKIAFITGITAVVLIIEWFLILSEMLPLNVIESSRINIPGYQTWFMSFSVPDIWIIIWCILSFVYALRNKKSAIVFSTISGSSMIFLALVTINFYMQNSMLFDSNYYQIFENIAVIWLIAAGGWLIYFGILEFDSISVRSNNQEQGSRCRTDEVDGD